MVVEMKDWYFLSVYRIFEKLLEANQEMTADLIMALYHILSSIQFARTDSNLQLSVLGRLSGIINAKYLIQFFTFISFEIFWYYWSFSWWNCWTFVWPELSRSIGPQSEVFSGDIFTSSKDFFHSSYFLKMSFCQGFCHRSKDQEFYCIHCCRSISYHQTMGDNFIFI